MENGFITIYLKDLIPFLDPKDAKSIILRYLHDRGIEGEVNSDQEGDFIRYIKPPKDVFDDFSFQFHKFITNYRKK